VRCELVVFEVGHLRVCVGSSSLSL
jgi:hypothetical protein